MVSKNFLFRLRKLFLNLYVGNKAEKLHFVLIKYHHCKEHNLAFQLELPDDCLDDFEEKINKSKLKLVLTNGKIQG